MVLGTVDPGYRMKQTPCWQEHKEEEVIYLMAERKQGETHRKNIPALGGFLLVLILFHITYVILPLMSRASLLDVCVTDLLELSSSQRAVIQTSSSEMLCAFSILKV